MSAQAKICVFDLLIWCKNGNLPLAYTKALEAIIALVRDFLALVSRNGNDGICRQNPL